MIRILPSFISHMVQIKPKPEITFRVANVIFISHMVQIKPTSIIKDIEKASRFISHMVQIKLLTEKYNAKPVDALYPTWFR